MSNTYRATSDYGKAQWGEDVFDGDFTAADERDHLDAGHLEIVPRTYKVLSDNFSGGPQGAEYMGALRKEIEDALVQGGHIMRVDDTAGEPTTFKDLTVDGGEAGSEVDDEEDPSDEDDL